MDDDHDPPHDQMSAIWDATNEVDATHKAFGDTDTTLAAFDSHAPRLAAAGVSPDVLAATRAQLATQPEQTLAALKTGLANAQQPATTDDNPAAAVGLRGRQTPGAPPTRRPASALGGLSMRQETGFAPGQEARAAARVSTGAHDKGGVSYGAFQMSSNGHVPQQFMAGEGKQWSADVAGMDPSVRNGPYGQAWKTIAAQDQNFYKEQHDFIERTHYRPAVGAVLKNTGIDLDGRSDAVRDVTWSTAVQHGGAPKLLTDAVNQTRNTVSPDDPGFDAALINNLYNLREPYAIKHADPEARAGLINRYAQERADALGMLKQ